MIADVTMSFPIRKSMDCAIILEVRESEVERLVMDLSGIVVKWVNGFRHLLLGNGVRLSCNTFNPKITLGGVLEETIIRVFGLEINKVIMASIMREQELEESRNCVIECVLMIFACTSEGAHINLCLDLEGGLKIRDKLYAV